MVKLSFWAKQHPHVARILLVVSRCLLICIACFLGNQLVASPVDISPLWTLLLIFLFLLACLLYPSGATLKNYCQRKLCDVAVCISGFLLTICLVVQLQKPFAFYPASQAAVRLEVPPYKYPEAQRLLEQFKNGDKTTFSHQEKRLIKKEFNYQLVRYTKATLQGNRTEKSNAGLIILACIAAVGLLFLVLSLACTLSCNGSDAAAIVVGLLGTAAVIWGLVAVIKNIKRKKQASLQ